LDTWIKFFTPYTKCVIENRNFSKMPSRNDSSKGVMKLCFFIFLLFATAVASAQSACDVRPGVSTGVPVIEFTTGHVVHSKMPKTEASPEAIEEEMLNLQEMEICQEKIIAQKCILKFEKQNKKNVISLYRANQRWNSWSLKSKERAERFIKGLKKSGFCS
jgi:hypothetical protein